MESEGWKERFLGDTTQTAWLLIGLCLLYSPLASFVGFVVYLLLWTFWKKNRGLIGSILAGVGLLFLVLAYFMSGQDLKQFIQDIFLNCSFIRFFVYWFETSVLSETLRETFINYNLFTFGMVWLFGSIGLVLFKDTTKEIEQKANKKQGKRHKLHKKPPMDFEGMEHVLATGTTGSGKTANILNYVENKIAKNEFVAIVDGKGGMKEFDLYTVTKKLAEKYGRKLYVLNQSDVDDPYASPYNPFSDLDPTAIRDFLVNMSEWESDHYKSLASYYWQIMAEILIESKEIPVTLPNIVYFSKPKNLLELLSHLDRNKIGAVLYDLAEELANGEEGEQAEISIARSAVFIAGNGRKIFADNEEGWNMRKAYDENAVVVVLLNELKYSDFAGSVGRFVIDDIKSLVGDLLKRYSDHSKSLVVLEEIGVYATDGMEGLLNRARSAGVQTIVSMQTFADTDKISPQLTRQIIGNTNNFLMMLNNDEETVDRLCKLVGTNKAVEVTKRTDYGEDTGQSSNRLVDSFILHPNDLKQIKKGSGEGFFYDKSKPNEVKKFKTHYVEV